jgi:hypothetical protein
MVLGIDAKKGGKRGTSPLAASDLLLLNHEAEMASVGILAHISCRESPPNHHQNMARSFHAPPYSMAKLILPKLKPISLNGN